MKRLFGCLALIILIIIALLLFALVRGRMEQAAQPAQSAAQQPSSGAPTQPVIRIASPANGARVRVGQPFQVHVVANDPGGVKAIASAVDGQLGSPIAAPSGQTTFASAIPLTIQSKGVHTIVVQAHGVSGTKSQPAAIRVLALSSLNDPTNPGDLPAPVPDVPTDPVSSSGNQAAPSGATVNFAANPTSIAQGQCSTLRWDVEGAREVYFEGVGVTGHEQQQECPTQTTNYTLTVVFQDGSARNYTAQVSVTAAVVIPGKPDLVIVDARIEPSEVTAGQPFNAVFTVANQGDVPSGPFTVFWQFHEVTGLKNCCSREFPNGIAAKGWGGGTFANLVTNSPAGTSPSWVEVDYTKRVDEGAAGEGNNKVSLTLTVKSGGAPSAFAATNATISVNRSSYSGPCPNTFTAGSKITANGAGTVKYRWERSDGTNSETRTLQFDAAGEKTVTNYDWSIPSSGNYWVRLRVLEPNDLASNRGETTWTCSGGSASQAPSAPRNCRGNASGAGIYLSWEEPVSPTPGQRNWNGFRVYQRGNNQPLKIFDNATVIAGAVENLMPNTTYNLDIRAYNAFGESPANACAVEVKTLAGSTSQVTKVTADVAPEIFTGACPKTINYSGVITTNGPGTVTYKWVRSNGESEARTINFTAAGSQTVTSGNVTYDQDGTHWAKLQVLAPNAMISDQAKFTLNCASPAIVTLVSVNANPTAFTGACPHTFHFNGTMATNAPGTVTYRWERSDGNSDTRTMNFSAASSQTIESGDFKSGSSGTFWARLHVLTPNDKVSNQATFTLTCK